jgi:hypothetical protein
MDEWCNGWVVVQWVVQWVVALDTYQCSKRSLN